MAEYGFNPFSDSIKLRKNLSAFKKIERFTPPGTSTERDIENPILFLNEASIASPVFDGIIPRTQTTTLLWSIVDGKATIGASIGGLIKLYDTDTAQFAWHTVTDIIVDSPATSDNPEDILTPNHIIITFLGDGIDGSMRYDAPESTYVTTASESWERKNTGTKGWILSSEGNAIFNNIAIRGEIEATRLSINSNEAGDETTTGIYWNGDPESPLYIGSDVNILGTLTAGALILNQYNYWTPTLTNADFRVGNEISGITWDGTTFEIRGNLVLGSIGSSSAGINGWNISEGLLASGETTTYVALSASPSNTYSIWAGGEIASTAPFSVKRDGTLSATNAIVEGEINASSGTFTGYVTAGTSRFGVGVQTSKNGIWLNTTNYWYDDGTINAESGKIGGWTLGSTTLTGGNSSLSSSGVITAGTSDDVAIISSADTNYRVWAGKADPSLAPFSITKSGALTASSANITGQINATSGYIGGATTGWVINSDYIQSRGGTQKLTLNGTAGNIYIGSGNHNNGDTPLYADGSGRFSLSNQLVFSPALGTTGGDDFADLTVIGKIRGSLENITAIPSNKLEVLVTGVNITSATEATITTATSLFLNNEYVAISGLTGNAAVANGVFQITVPVTGGIPSPTTFTISITGGVVSNTTGITDARATLRELTMGLHSSKTFAVASSGGTSGQNTVTISASNSNITVGQKVSGNGIGLNARVSAISSNGTTITLTVNNSATVSGNLIFSYYDSGIGLRLDDYNWWFTNNQFRVGTQGSSFRWDGTRFLLQGSGTKTLQFNVGSTDSDNFLSIVDKGSVPTYNTPTTPFYVDASGKFSLGQGLTWSGTSLTVNGTGTFTGAINATSGYIGGTNSGWLISSDLLSNGTVGLYGPSDKTGTIQANSNVNEIGSTTFVTQSATIVPKIGMSIISASNLFAPGAYITNVSGTSPTYTITISNPFIFLNANQSFTISEYAIYAGNATKQLAPFKVDYFGNLWATSANITGTINATAGNFRNTVYVGNNATASNNIQLIGTSTAASTAIGIGTGTLAYNTPATRFWADASGRFSLGQGLTWDGTNLTINGSGTFSGSLSAATGTFSGSLSAATGTFSGSINAGSGTIASWQINDNYLSGTNFSIYSPKSNYIYNLIQNPTFLAANATGSSFVGYTSPHTVTFVSEGLFGTKYFLANVLTSASGNNEILSYEIPGNADGGSNILAVQCTLTGSSTSSGRTVTLTASGPGVVSVSSTPVTLSHLTNYNYTAIAYVTLTSATAKLPKITLSTDSYVQNTTNFRVRNLMVEYGNNLSEYFDGTYPGANWTGVPFASISRKNDLFLFSSNNPSKRFSSPMKADSSGQITLNPPFPPAPGTFDGFKDNQVTLGTNHRPEQLIFGVTATAGSSTVTGTLGTAGMPYIPQVYAGYLITEQGSFGYYTPGTVIREVVSRTGNEVTLLLSAPATGSATNVNLYAKAPLVAVGGITNSLRIPEPQSGELYIENPKTAGYYPAKFSVYNDGTVLLRNIASTASAISITSSLDVTNKPGIRSVVRGQLDISTSTDGAVGTWTANGSLPRYLINIYSGGNVFSGGIYTSGGTSDSTITYYTFSGTHYSQLPPLSEYDNLYPGTIIESTGDLVNGGSYHRVNQYLPKSKISDTYASKSVYGVYYSDHKISSESESDGIGVTGVGALYIRINKDVEVSCGDLIMSNGDGTGTIQPDDIIKSCTVGKVTSTEKIRSYEDGSYIVPAVLYCG